MNNTNYKEKTAQLKTIVSPTLSDTVDLVIPLHIYYKRMMQEVKKFLEEKYDLSKSELNLLLALAATADKSNTLAPTELYEHLVFSSGGMTKLLKKLEIKDFILRVENPEDKRSKLVQLTKKGKDIASTAINDVITLEGKYFSCLNDIERSVLLTAFEKLAINSKDNSEN